MVYTVYFNELKNLGRKWTVKVIENNDSHFMVFLGIVAKCLKNSLVVLKMKLPNVF
jgi:hypothetical protein